MSFGSNSPPLQPPLTRSEVCAILRSVSADCIWLLNQIEAKGGWLEFPPELSLYVQSLGVSDYPKLYENERTLKIVTLRSCFTVEEFARKMAAIESASGSGREHFLKEFMVEVGEIVEGVVLPKSPEDVAAVQQMLESLSDADRAEAILQAKCYFAGFLASFHQILAVMVHGEKMTSLVAKAKAGNEDALLKAIQVDGRVLTHIPYFRDLHAAAIAAGDKRLLAAIGRRAGAPPYKGRIRHKALWMGMSVLDEIGALSALSHKDILDVFDDSGLNDGPDRVEDVNSLTKMLSSFREFQRSGGLSMQ